MLSVLIRNLSETFKFQGWRLVRSLNPEQKREDRAMPFAADKIHLSTHGWLLPALALPLAEGKKPRPGNGDRQGLLTIAEVDGTRAYDAETVPVELDAWVVVTVDN